MGKENLRKDQILKFINNYISENGYSPTIREICAHTKLSSTSSAHHYLDILKREGRIESVSHKSRSLTTGSTRLSYHASPLIGNVSAGQGMLAQENIEGYIPVPKEIYGDNNLFILRVQGDSMINVGINNNDYVIVSPQNDAEIGEIIVALWDETATVKRLGSKVPFVLIPENDTMKNIELDAGSCTILGKVVGCMKKF